MPGRPIPLRIEQATLDRLDRIAEALSERAAGVRVTRADASRIALDRGAEALEKELGLSRAPKRKR